MATLPAHGDPPATTFPPLRHGLKAVFGNHGNDHGGDFAVRIPQMIEHFHELGVDLTRIELKWAINEPEPGRYDWSEADRLIGALAEAGIEPMLMFYCPPKWAMVGPPEDEELFIRLGFENLYTVVWAQERYKSDFRRFAEEMARRYRGKTNLVEFWNEPDGMAGPTVLRDVSGRAVSIRFGGDPVLYTEWLKVFYEGVKAGNPDAQVAAGSLCEPDTRFLEAMYACGAADFCDAISVHPYPHHSDQINDGLLEAMRDVMLRYGDWKKPMWVTEFGWSTGGDFVDPVHPKPTTEMEAQAARIGPMFERIHRLPYVTQFYFFTLNDWGHTPENPGGINGFGITDFHLNKKPSFAAYQRTVADSPREPRVVPAPGIALCGQATPLDVPAGRGGTVRASVTNPGEEQAVAVDVWSDALEVHAPLSVVARAGRTEIEVAIRVRADAAPGTYPLTFEIAGRTMDRILLSVPAPAPRFDPPPVIDGATHEWAGRLPIAGEGFRAGLAWSEAGLYLACVVQSGTHTAGTWNPDHWTNDALWKSDSLQVGIDPLREAVRSAMPRPDDSEYLLALTTTGVHARRDAALEGQPVGPVASGAVAILHRNGTTTYEAFFPWADIHSQTPKAGDTIGISLLVNDVVDGERTTSAWGGGIAGKKMPSAYASIVLEP